MEEEEYPKFWKKAIKGSVGGRFMNKKGDPEEFLLKGDPNDDSADISVEVYDVDAEKYFKKANKTAITQGYLIEISEENIFLDETNAVSDGYLKDLLKGNINKLKSRVDKFTSSVPVIRLLEFAERENKPVKTVEYLKTVIKKLETKPKKVKEIDSVNIGSVQ